MSRCRSVPLHHIESLQRVADLMTPEVLSIGQDDSLATAHGIMRMRRIRHLPVIACDGRLVDDVGCGEGRRWRGVRQLP